MVEQKSPKFLVGVRFFRDAPNVAVGERLKPPVCKTGSLRGYVGSNPTGYTLVESPHFSRESPRQGAKTSGWLTFDSSLSTLLTQEKRGGR